MPIDESKIKQINVRSEYFQDILDRVPSRIAIWGNTGLLIIFFLVALGMRFIRYPEVVNSQVLITTDNPPIEVYSRTSGRISTLLKNDQDSVAAGDWIIILNNTANYTDVLKVKEAFKNISTDNLLNALNILKLPETLNVGEIQASYAQFLKSLGELKLFVNLDSYNKQLYINTERQHSLDSLKRQLDNQLAILERQSTLAKLDYERNVKLQKDTVIARAELEQKEISYLSQKTKTEDLRNTIINSKIQGEMLNKENATLRTDKDNSYFSLKNNLIQYYSNLVFELSAWENKYVIQAPVSGMLNLYEFRSKDQFLINETKVFTVTPQNHLKYFAIMKLPVASSGRVRVGQSCIIRLHNYPYTEFGSVMGKIESISAAAKEGFYNVRVLLPKQLKTTLNIDLNSTGELVGDADIVIKDYNLFTRLFNYLLSKNY